MLNEENVEKGICIVRLIWTVTVLKWLHGQKNSFKKEMVGELVKSHVQDSAMNVILMYLSPKKKKKYCEQFLVEYNNWERVKSLPSYFSSFCENIPRKFAVIIMLTFLLLVLELWLKYQEYNVDRV